jgi:hypothetical protein
MRKTKVKTAALPGGWTLPFIFAALAMALALLAIPHLGHAQGIVRGAQQGAHEGNRVAGPVGVLGLPEPRWHHCRGYHDGYGRFHCYRHD